MIVTAFSNGKEYPYGNGITLSASDRTLYLKREWGFVTIELGDTGKVITANIDKDSLWTGKCLHLLNVEIGLWLYAENLSPWAKRRPPKIKMMPLGGNEFKLIKP